MPETLPKCVKLPECPRKDCDADTPHYLERDSLDTDEWIAHPCYDHTQKQCEAHGPTFTRCYSAHVNLSESPTGSPGGDEPEAVDLESLTAERDELRDWRDKVAHALWCRGCDELRDWRDKVAHALWCRGCGAQYPCRTRRAAEDVE